MGNKPDLEWLQSVKKSQQQNVSYYSEKACKHNGSSVSKYVCKVTEYHITRLPPKWDFF